MKEVGRGWVKRVLMTTLGNLGLILTMWSLGWGAVEIRFKLGLGFKELHMPN